MKTYLFFPVFFIIVVFFNNDINAQSAKLLEQINFFSTYEITEKLDELRLLTYNNKEKAQKALMLIDDLKKMKQECVIGYATCNLLINKLNYYDKKEYLLQVNKIKLLFKRIHSNIDEIQNYAKKISKNPNKYKKRTMLFLQKKINVAGQIQKELQNFSPTLAKINDWEVQYADGGISYK